MQSNPRRFACDNRPEGEGKDGHWFDCALSIMGIDRLGQTTDIGEKFGEKRQRCIAARWPDMVGMVDMVDMVGMAGRWSELNAAGNC